MWLLTPFGFFSIVQKPDDKGKGTLTVRARVREDLQQLKDIFLPGMGDILEHQGSDYRYRAKAPRGEVAVAVANVVMHLDYANFKDEVKKKQGTPRSALYGEVWNVLYKLPDKPASSIKKKTPYVSEDAAPQGDSGLKIAYGGLLVDEVGRVLLREPANHFDGYIWTFPKGRPDAGESPEQTALREVKEETGYSADIIEKLPGEFAGGTTINRYFIMRPLGDRSAFEKETSDVKWATFDEARNLIRQTTNLQGRARDLAVLSALETKL